MSVSVSASVRRALAVFALASSRYCTGLRAAAAASLAVIYLFGTFGIYLFIFDCSLSTRPRNTNRKEHPRPSHEMNDAKRMAPLPDPQ